MGFALRVVGATIRHAAKWRQAAGCAGYRIPRQSSLARASTVTGGSLGRDRSCGAGPVSWWLARMTTQRAN